MLFALLFLMIGLALVILGADRVIEGASSLAKRLSVSEMVIGLTVVAFGTSAPELVVNSFSSLAQKNGLVLGNIIGSNIFNTLLILGVAALIYPLTLQKNSVKKEIPFSIFALVLFAFLANDSLLFPASPNQVSRWDGIILLVFFAGFLVYTFILSRDKVPSGDDIKLYSWPKTWLFIILGFVALFIGGKLVVDNAIIIAQKLQVSDKLIGLTIVAFGTSLPELATTAMASYKRRSDLAVGNVVGSNIFNILFIMGVSSTIFPIKYEVVFNHDLLVIGLASLLLFAAMFTGKKHKLDRWEAVVLLLMYILYTAYIIYRK